MTLSFPKRQLALFVLFFLPGFGLSSWVTRTPALRDSLGASTEQMGFVLFGLSIGSLGGILLSGLLTTKFGTRNIIRLGLLTLCAGLAMLSASAGGQSAVLAFIGLSLFGMGVGWMEVAVNVEGAVLEEISGKSLMPALHGCFSLGTFVGGLLGMAMTSFHVSVVLHVAAAAVIVVALSLVFLRWVPRKVSPSGQEPSRKSFKSALASGIRDPLLLTIGVFILALALAEGSANDWLALLMVDDYGFSQSGGSPVYVLFSCAMTTGRFCGGFAVDRLGRGLVVRGSAVSAAIGLLLIIVSNNPIVAAAAVFFWGMGAALGFPLGISAAAASGSNGAVRVSIVATIGYIAFLVGPPSLGLIGEHYGLRIAFTPVLALVCVAVLVAGFVGRGRAPATRQAKDLQRVKEHI